MKQRLLGNSLVGMGDKARQIGPPYYLVNDTFTTNRAAGAVNGTNAEPGPGRRVVVDGNNKLSLSSGNAVFATGGVGGGDPTIRYGIQSVTPGRVCVAEVSWSAGGVDVGFDADQTGGISDSVRATSTTLTCRVAGTLVTVGAVALSTAYRFAVVQRSAGSFYFVKGGAFTNWTLIWVGTTSTGMYPGAGVIGATSVVTLSYLRVPATLWLPTPLASDGFSAWGTTDGAGHAEVTGLGSGGSGLAWTSQVGTWTASGGAANATSLTSTVAIATVNTSTADVMATVKYTHSAGNGNVLVRYVDASNWVAARYTGTNAQMVKNVAGVQTTLVDVAAAYVAGAELRIICEGQKFRLYYNGVLIGAEQTIADAGLQSGTRQGIRTTDTGNTFDDFMVRARGTGGEYAALDNF